jgi:hypothetical protein
MSEKEAAEKLKEEEKAAMKQAQEYEQTPEGKAAAKLRALEAQKANELQMTEDLMGDGPGTFSKDELEELLNAHRPKKEEPKSTPAMEAKITASETTTTTGATVITGAAEATEAAAAVAASAALSENTGTQAPHEIHETRENLVPTTNDHTPEHDGGGEPQVSQRFQMLQMRPNTSGNPSRQRMKNVEISSQVDERVA